MLIFLNRISLQLLQCCRLPQEGLERGLPSRQETLYRSLGCLYNEFFLSRRQVFRLRHKPRRLERLRRLLLYSESRLWQQEGSLVPLKVLSLPPLSPSHSFPFFSYHF